MKTPVHPVIRGFVILIAFLGALRLATARKPASSTAVKADLGALQNEYAEHQKEKRPRAFHFGSQGAGDVFSNHASHSNRLIPVYVFGAKADLGAVIGKNSGYRTEEGVKRLYGTVPPNTVNPTADYADQSDLFRVQRDAVKRGAKHLFIVWFDGMDWEATRAAAIAKTGRVYREGKGAGLVFQEYEARYAGKPSAQFGFYVTSPTRDKHAHDLDAQSVKKVEQSLPGGYDVLIGGPNPWTLGPLGPKAPGYFKGQSANKADREAVAQTGRVLHAYTDSAPSAGEFATGVKSYNNGINVTEDGRFPPTLFHLLQKEGWKVGTVTSVPFDHASPAAFAAHNVHRDDYQDLARDMLGLESIAQAAGREARHPGLDVVLGAGFGQSLKEIKTQGKNGVAGNPYIAAADLQAIDVRNGGKYVVVQRSPGVPGRSALLAAAETASKTDRRLFGFFGAQNGHLPYRTADGDYKPAKGRLKAAERYSPADLDENPTLADMTEAALTVLASQNDKPFALFVEAGDVDFALHDNNLDNAVGAILSGEQAVETIISWVETHSNWNDSVLIVTADHGHYLVLDQPEAIAGTARK